MLTELPLIVVAAEGAIDGFQFSPTQISTHIECERKWAWRRIAHVEVAPHASAELGTRSHSMLENYLGEGVRPDFVADREVASIVSAGLHLLPEPKLPGMQLERSFRFKSARTGFYYGGFKDVEIAPGVHVPSLGFDGSVPIVIDHKTTRSIDSYAKTEDDLQYDAQSTIYALDSMVRFDAPAADLGWIYYQTKGAKRASPTRTRLHRGHALRVFDTIERVAEVAASALEKKLTPLDLPPNPRACSAYGGCPYRHRCNLSPSQSARSRMSNSLIADLRARVQGTPAPAPEPTPEKPSLMGCPATEVPAPDKIPDIFLKPSTVDVNPPESKLPPPAAEAKTETVEEPKAKRTRRTKAEMAADAAAKDPKGADAHAHTSAPSDIGTPHPEVADIERKTQDKIDTFVATCGSAEKQEQELEDTIAATTREGFTLYVDCIPIGKPAKTCALLIEKAQEKIFTDGPKDSNGKQYGDYRLVPFGTGAPMFVKFVVEQLDESTDLMLDTRTPEGAILLEPLVARAAFVVRGLR